MTWRTLIGPASVVLVWAAVTSFGLVRPLFLPPPLDVLSSLYLLLVDGPLWSDIVATIYRTVAAFLLAAFFGLLLGVPLGVSRKFYDATEVVLDYRYCFPFRSCLVHSASSNPI